MFNGERCFIIAELSANHGGELSVALETVKAAKIAGADAIKLTLNVKSDLFRIKQGTHWDGQYLYDLYTEASLSWEWHKPLFALAKEEGLVCFSSPFDKTAVDFLEGLNVPAYKVASFEITDIPLIEYIASKGKPVIISTGIATLEDIDLALETCRKAGNNQITLLQCTSAYPALPQDANLLTIPDLKKRFNVNVGLSDHTLGIEAPVVATALGAKVIEKHFILDRKIGGPDAHFSLDETEFKQMVCAVRTCEKMLGRPNYELDEKKAKSREFSRSLFISEDIKAGEIITEKNVRSVRPNYGMHTKHYKSVLGKKAAVHLRKGTPLSEEHIEGGIK
jgi:pseudaminic acid synthase